MDIRIADVQVTLKATEIGSWQPWIPTYQFPKRGEAVGLRALVDCLRSKSFPSELDLEVRLPDSPPHSILRDCSCFLVS